MNRSHCELHVGFLIFYYSANNLQILFNFLKSSVQSLPRLIVTAQLCRGERVMKHETVLRSSHLSIV